MPRESGTSGDVEAKLLVCKKLVRAPNGTEFAEPVPFKKLRLDDYPQVVKRPMSLACVEKRVNEGCGDAEFWDLLELIWYNCELYNGKNSAYGKMAQKMRKLSATHRATYERHVDKAAKPKKVRSTSKQPFKAEKVKAEKPVVVETPVPTPVPTPVVQHVRQITHIPSVLEQNPPMAIEGTGGEVALSLLPPEGVLDPRRAAMAATLVARVMKLNESGLALFMRYMMKIMESRGTPGGVYTVTAKEKEQHSSGGNDTQDALRVDFGTYESHELRAMYCLVEKLMDSGAVKYS